MKIIQSFAQFDEGTPHKKDHEKTNKTDVYLNFYSFLLSYLTLKKYYGEVTMFCNKKAYNTFIKYVPYDKIVKMENKNTILLWSYYKIDAMKKMKEKFIHVDTDVFIFDDLFREFIDGDYDIIAQNRWAREQNAYIRDFVDTYKEYVIDNDIIDPDIYDGGSLCSGVVGMTPEICKGYDELASKIKAQCINDELSKMSGGIKQTISIVSEELSLYLYALKNKLKVFDVLPRQEIINEGILAVAKRRKFTHLWFNNKFKPQYIEIIKLRIKKDFPESYHLVEKYDVEVMSKIMITENL